MKKTKLEKGITLIALIITIVVLLILAAVAISSIKNDNILGYAINAAKDYNQAVKNEQSELEKYKEFLDINSGGIPELTESYLSKLAEQGYSVDAEGKLTSIDASKLKDKTKIEIPLGVTSVSTYAFDKLTSISDQITSITFSDTVTEIGPRLFGKSNRCGFA